MCATAQNGFNRRDFRHPCRVRQKVSPTYVNVYGAAEARLAGWLRELKALWIDLKERIGDAAASKAV
jgi:hypothetical protein